MAAATKGVRAFLSDIKLAHTVFALPFAVSAVFLADLPMPTLAQWVLLLACMFFARTFAMGINRLVDADIDGGNLRTKSRAIPSGKVGKTQVAAILSLVSFCFVVSASLLNPLAGWLAIPLLLVFWLYPFWKRWGWGAHWYLGLCLGLAPIGVFVALGQTVPIQIYLLSAGICFWTGGFDVIYALMDEAFDIEHGLHSVPSRFGRWRALWISRASLFLATLLFVAAGVAAHMGWIYFVGVALIAGLFVGQHVIARQAASNQESIRIDIAFFHANAAVSMLYLTFVILDTLSSGVL